VRRIQVCEREGAFTRSPRRPLLRRERETNRCTKKPSALTNKVLGSGDALLIRLLPQPHPLPRGLDRLPRRCPAAMFSYGRRRSAVPCLSRRCQKAKTPMINSPGFLFWRRPTLARPFAVLPSGLQRFTSVFGMGTGGATTLMSPERRSACAARLWCVTRDSLNRYIGRFAQRSGYSRFTILSSRFRFSKSC
jgi:hypothetical protein